MPDQHDQAVEWAQANPNDPRSQDIQAKAWANKNPQDPRAVEILQRFSSPSKNAHTSSDDKMRNGWDAIKAFNPPESVYMEAAKHPITGMEDPVYQAAGLVAPTAPFAGLGSLFRKGGDALMQKAAGASKLIPGLGERMAQAGMVGTKAGMAKQAATGLNTSGQAISDLASKIPGTISQDSVANQLAEIANSKMTPSGFVRPEDAPVVNRVLSKAQDLAKAEPITGTEMAARRAQAGKAAREAGAYRSQPSQQLKAQLASREQAGYSKALKDAYGSAFPNQPNLLGQADQNYSTYKQASDLLNKPESVSGLSDLMSQITPTTLAGSVAGRASIGIGKGLQSVKPTPIYSSEELLRNFMSKKNDE